MSRRIYPFLEITDDCQGLHEIGRSPGAIGKSGCPRIEKGYKDEVLGVADVNQSSSSRSMSPSCLIPR